MSLLNNRISIESTNPQTFYCTGKQQYNQELTIDDNRNYISIIPCLFAAVLNAYSNKLLPRDIVFFVQLLNLYSAALNKNQKTIIYSSEKLAKLLGYKAKEKSNMRSIVLRRIKRLEEIGLIKVIRSKDKKGSNKVNELIPILPNHLYDKLKYEPSNFNVDNSRIKGESNIQHILRTKLFTPIDLEFMKSLFDDATITATQKLFYLNCIIIAYKNYQTTGKLSFAATSKELMRTNNISRDTLTRILNYIKNQYPDYFIEVWHSYTKSDYIDSNRYDKSIFVISINLLVIPQSFFNKNNVTVQEEIEQTKKVEEQVEYRDIDNACLVANNETQKPDTYAGFQAASLKWKPSILKMEAHNNKDIIIKKESNKNIDANIVAENDQIKPQTFIQTSNSEHLESELCSLSSKSLKNIIKDFMDVLPTLPDTNNEDASSTIKDISDKKNKINIPNKCNTVIHNKTTSQSKAINDRKHYRQHKDLRYFYPLSEEEANMLNFKANREFSTNFTNQLLLKLYIKYPEKRFKNKFTFSSYMITALKNEHHQGPRVNNPSFRFSCNIDDQEKRVLECEQYLIKVESSSDTCKISQVRKKIAGRFSSEISHSILTTARFIESSSSELLTILLPENLALSKMQREILMSEVCSVYGNNNCYLDRVKTELKISNATGNKEETQSASTSEPSCSNPRSTPLSSLKQDSVWHQVRQALVLQYGNDIDAVWFSKVVASECKETSLLTLTMPTRFMADWLKNNYGYAISRISGVLGVRYIEYNY
ncbi:MAG: DnaA N-terminal domain-containing protein [Rickettsia endosymbiont of Pentastiridius leporinus]